MSFMNFHSHIFTFWSFSHLRWNVGGCLLFRRIDRCSNFARATWDHRHWLYCALAVLIWEAMARHLTRGSDMGSTDQQLAGILWEWHHLDVSPKVMMLKVLSEAFLGKLRKSTCGFSDENQLLQADIAYSYRQLTAPQTLVIWPSSSVLSVHQGPGCYIPTRIQICPRLTRQPGWWCGANISTIYQL